ncbi:MAG: polyphosphate kinase 1 [Bacteroidetes bacterium]|nr:MAG: polyphosphate kinase 1 [Bacteroidota bacterium]PTM20919.1 MAG: polyphosphate kinase 1 [Bacteroidota bacterium]
MATITTDPEAQLNSDFIEGKLAILGEDYFDNYELSWLQFNQRVMEEAKKKHLPLLERVNFISIVCSNLDEFFEKRVGGLKRQYHAGVKELSIDGRTPREQLTEIRKAVKKMIESYRDLFFSELVPDLETHGIVFRSIAELSPEEQARAEEYFDRRLFPLIIPLAVDESHPFPFISNKSLSLAIMIRDPETGKERFARIKIPANRPRWIAIQNDRNETVLISTSEIVETHLDRFFPGMEILSSNIFRVTRNADIEKSDEEADDLLEMIEEELRERRFSEIVRLELDKDTPRFVVDYLKSHLHVNDEDIYLIDDPIGLADLRELHRLPGFDGLRFDPWVPAMHPLFRHPSDEPVESIFDTIKQGDFMVHHPYHSFETSTQRFVEEAARDPNVLAIKQTLYRTSSDSEVMKALMRAAENGKQVAVLIELKARFDEERNIQWAQRLEKAGAHVSYGMSGLKIHSKLTGIVREEGDELRHYVHIGTGNYHPDTAQLYEDLGYFTCREDIAADVSKLFNLLTGYSLNQTFQTLMVAPRELRNSLTSLIEAETEAAKNGQKARIIAKMNNLDDPLIIQKLYEASEAGVEIDLIVRSVCRLQPGKEGLSEQIRVHAIIGRFLEHSRCYYFYAGGEEKFMIGSADWMRRNLDARVEILVPIEPPELKEYLRFLLNLYLKDNQQRWIKAKKGTYKRVKSKKGEDKISVHESLMDHTKRTQDPVPSVSRSL